MRAERGRGAVSNPDGRFARLRVDPFDDGWGDAAAGASGDGSAAEPGAPPPRATIVTPEVTRTILSTNDSPDIPFDRSINPYKGCEHGCVYCYARPTHSCLGLSPGLDFETKIVSKPDAARLLRETLAKAGYRCEPIALGSNTDPYQPIERELRITRGILEVLAEHDHPVTIVTKSNLVLRDLDLLAPMAARRLAHVFVSVTTLDRALARRMEPRAPTPERRLEALGALRDAGVPCGVLAAPMILGINDAEMERILEAAAAAGARWAGYILLRLPNEVKELFSDWLEAHYPLRAAHVLSLVRQTRGGKLNEPAFGARMRGEGEYAEMIRRRFKVTARRLGLDGEPEALDTTLFPVVGRANAASRASAPLRLFE